MNGCRPTGSPKTRVICPSKYRSKRKCGRGEDRQRRSGLVTVTMDLEWTDKQKEEEKKKEKKG